MARKARRQVSCTASSVSAKSRPPRLKWISTARRRRYRSNARDSASLSPCLACSRRSKVEVAGSIGVATIIGPFGGARTGCGGRAEDIVPQGRSYPVAAGVVGEVVIEVIPPPEAEHCAAGRATMDADVERLVEEISGNRAGLDERAA